MADCSAHPGEHEPGYLAVLDSFAVSLKTMTEPFSIALKLALEPDWALEGPKVVKLIEGALPKLAPPVMIPAVFMEIEGILNNPLNSLPMMPFELPGLGKLPLGSFDIAGDIMAGMGGLPSGPDMPSFPNPFALGLDVALGVGTALVGLVMGLVIDLPLGLLSATVSLDPPMPPLFGIPDIIATIPGLDPISAEILSECIIAKFVPLVPYEDPEEPGPGLEAAMKLLDDEVDQAPRYAEIIRDYPEEKESILEAISLSVFSNVFAQQVAEEVDKEVVAEEDEPPPET